VDQSTRQNLSSAFNNVLRTSVPAGKVDMQRISMAFGLLLEQQPEDSNVVPLDELYDFLLQQKMPEPAVRELIVFLQSREARFGVTMQLPAALASLSEEERGRIVLAVAARGQSSSTFPGSGKSEPEPAPAASASPPRSDGGFVPEGKRKGGAHKGVGRMIVFLVLTLLGLGASLAYDNATRLPVPTEIALQVPGGLPCAKLLQGETAFFCFVGDAVLKSTTLQTLKAQTDVTRNATVARGLRPRQIQVLSLESRDLKHVFDLPARR